MIKVTSKQRLPCWSSEERDYDLSNASRSPAHIAAPEESVKRVSVLLGMLTGQSNMRAASA